MNYGLDMAGHETFAWHVHDGEDVKRWLEYVDQITRISWLHCKNGAFVQEVQGWAQKDNYPAVPLYSAAHPGRSNIRPRLFFCLSLKTLHTRYGE